MSWVIQDDRWTSFPNDLNLNLNTNGSQQFKVVLPS